MGEGKTLLTEGSHLTCKTVFWLLKICRHMCLTIKHWAWRVNFTIVSLMNNSRRFKFSRSWLELLGFVKYFVMKVWQTVDAWLSICSDDLCSGKGKNRVSLLNHCLLRLFDSKTLNMILESCTMCLASSLIKSYICR